MTRVEAGDDADAALIDRLYGGPDSERAGDAELDGLRRVRGLIARVRDEAPEVEPPQAVSALLLQAAEASASRWAPAVAAPARAGLWVRLRGWLSTMAAHPAMAAAATLMVVAGATALWMRSGGEVAEPEHHAERPAAQAPVEPDEPDDQLAQPPVGGVAPTAPAADPEPAAETAVEAAKVAPKPGISLDQPSGRRSTAEAGKDSRPARKAGGAGDDKAVTTTQEAEAPPPPPRAPEAKTPAKKQAPPVEPAPATAPDAVAAPREEQSGAALAAEYTRQAIVAAQRGNCQTVERLAVKARAADASYYEARFETQADIKKCRAKAKG